MKLILSRKGFDSSNGGAPSPIFPNRSILSLPIPDKASAIAYGDIAGNGLASVGELVEDLAHQPLTHRAHLDPDLLPDSIRRDRGWRPIFGQEGAAESHLRNQGVGPGDVFLFFGLFRPVEKTGGRWQRVPGSRCMHVIFGWLQIAERIAVADWPSDAGWALYHPHFRRSGNGMNSIYVASERLSLPGTGSLGVDGSGVFPRFSPRLRLTEPDSDCVSQWLLPDWFYPDGRPSTLSYHGDITRWERSPGGTKLKSVARGQEFVLDCDNYPEAICWLRSLLR